MGPCQSPTQWCGDPYLGSRAAVGLRQNTRLYTFVEFTWTTLAPFTNSIIYLCSFFSVLQQTISGLDRFIVEFLDHKKLYTYTPGRTPLDARRRGRYHHNTQQTKEKSIHILSGIQTRNSCN